MNWLRKVRSKMQKKYFKSIEAKEGSHEEKSLKEQDY